MNHGKTNFLQFCDRKRPNYSPLLEINGNNLGMNISSKYLELTITTNFNWGQYIENITKIRLAMNTVVSLFIAIGSLFSKDTSISIRRMMDKFC